MNISYPYLKDFLNTQLSQKKLAEVFTRVGFECEINKSVIEFDVTPNRGDVLSLRGLQREFNAFQLKNFKNSLKVIQLNAKQDASVINKIDKKGCGNYHLLLVRGLSKIKSAAAMSPGWTCEQKGDDRKTFRWCVKRCARNNGWYPGSGGAGHPHGSWPALDALYSV